MLGDASDTGHVPHADSVGNHERMFDWIREVPMPVGCRSDAEQLVRATMAKARSRSTSGSWSSTTTCNPVDITSLIRLQYGDPTQVRESWSIEEANQVVAAGRERLDQSELGIFLCLMPSLALRPGKALRLLRRDIKEVGQDL